tara:strand:- start:8389 stop:9147 length:759 start_codon:yes stop_codon:yes gene_type:complete
MSIEIIFSEFGRKRYSGGWGSANNPLPTQRLEPTYSSVKKYFPDAKIVLYTDTPDLVSEFKNTNIEIRLVVPPFDKSHNRYGNRCNDFYKIVGLLNIEKDVGMAIDSDMVFCNNNVKHITEITKKVGCCFVKSPRMIGHKELNAIDGTGTKYSETDFITPTQGSPITFYKNDNRCRKLLEHIENSFRNSPHRLVATVLNSIWETGIYPYILPFVWCVCSNNMEFQNVKGNYIILHIGDPIVYKYWKEHLYQV